MNTISLNELDSENTFYHFTSRDNYESISLNGLIPSIGDNANGIEKTSKVFFSKGNIGFLRICDVWINWFIYRISLYNSVLKYKDITKEEYDPFDTDEAKSHEKEEFTNRMYLGYITSSDKVESFNMHTKSGVGVDKEKISKVTINDDDSALSILKEIYKEEKEKDNGLEFAFLDRFMNYVNSMDQDIKL